MNDLLHRLFNANERRAREPEAQTSEPAGSAGPKRMAADSVRGQEDGHTSTQPEQPGVEARTADVAEPARAEAADEASLEIGEQVAGILSSAKQAAQQLRESAQQEAERIRAEAKQQATDALDRTKKELERRREEGGKVRAEADAYSKNTRETADRHAAEMRRKFEEEAAKQRSEAQQEAAEIRRAARQKAEELTTQTLQRQKALVAEAQRSEARLQQLLGVYRAMTSQLEDLLGPERAVASGEPPVHVLDEALKPRPVGHPPG
jgi:gas vesicle protein